MTCLYNSMAHSKHIVFKGRIFDSLVSLRQDVGCTSVYCTLSPFYSVTESFLTAEVHVNIRQDGVGVPEFLNEPWSPSDQRIVVNEIGSASCRERV